MLRIALTLLSMIGLSLALFACGNQNPQPAPTDLPATSVPAATQEAFPTLAPPTRPPSQPPATIPPTATPSPTPAPTATPSPTPSQRATPTPSPSPTNTPEPSPNPNPTATPASTGVENTRQLDSVTWTFPPTMDGNHIHFAGTTSQPGLLQEFTPEDDTYCSQFQLYRGSGQRDWVTSIADPLPAGWRYEETPEITVVNGQINSATGQFSVTARINGNALADTKDLYLSVESRVALGADGFCLPSETYSQIPISSGKIPDGVKSFEHYHLDAIQWADAPTITGDIMSFAGKTSPGAIRLTWQEGYCSQFHLYELDESGYHYIDSINPLPPSGQVWTEPVTAEVTRQHTAADGTFEATVKLSESALKRYRNPVLLVRAASVLDDSINRCSKTETLSAIDIRSATALLSPSPTPASVLQPTPSPTPAPVSQPTPSPTPTTTPASLSPNLTLLSQHDTQNVQWLESAHPGPYRQIQELPWVKDGLSERERETIDDLLYIGVGDIANLEAILDVAWFQDDVTETEKDAVYWLRGLNYDNERAASAIIAMPWLQDDVTETEKDALRWLRSLSYDNEEASAEIIAMPFLRSLEYDDALAIRGIRNLAYDGLLPSLVNTQAWRAGFTDAQTTLIAAAGALNHPDEVSRMMHPGYADVETLSSGQSYESASSALVPCPNPPRQRPSGKPWSSPNRRCSFPCRSAT